jgi:UDP:flavonoid glycosyltransferase YjiC (YdhE family)
MSTTRWLIVQRREGTTTALVWWLAAGRPLPGWPGWSRLLVVRSAREIERVQRDHGEVDALLRDRGCSGGLGRVLLGPSDVGSMGRSPGMRGMSHEIEVAVDDDLDAVLALAHAGRPPVLASLGGTSTRVGALLAEIAEQLGPDVNVPDPLCAPEGSGS